jgi:hypothetical protein
LIFNQLTGISLQKQGPREASRENSQARLSAEANLFADGHGGIADLIDGTLQFVFCHFQMFGPAAYRSAIVHRNLAAGAFTFADANPDHLIHPRRLQQKIAAVCESLARQRAIHFCVSPVAGWKSFGMATCHMRLIGPVDRGDIDIVAKPQHLTSSVVHEHGEEKNDRQRDSDQPKQSTLSERHDGLHSIIMMERKHVRVPLVPFRFWRH